MAGLATVVIQYLVGAQNEGTTGKALQTLMQEQLKVQRAEIGAELEKSFVRKSALDSTLERLNAKLDLVDGKLDRQNSKISRIEGYLKADRADWSQAGPRPTTWSSR